MPTNLSKQREVRVYGFKKKYFLLGLASVDWDLFSWSRVLHICRFLGFSLK